MQAKVICDNIRRMTGYNSLVIPEFTFGDLRIDAIAIDIRHRWIRGFEIKIKREDYVRDTKWTLYSEFCSSLSIVCPEGLIQKDEVQPPFGLLWFCGEDDYLTPRWIRKPKNIQKRDSMAWIFTYLRVLEAEMPRLMHPFP
jgi:hypothetical protein